MYGVQKLGGKMNWHSRYKAMKKGMKLTNTDIAEITGNTPESIATTTQPKSKFPRWAKLAVVIYERLSEC